VTHERPLDLPCRGRRCTDSGPGPILRLDAANGSRDVLARRSGLLHPTLAPGSGEVLRMDEHAMSHPNPTYYFSGFSFVGTGERCSECGGTIAEHESITFTATFTEAELANPENPYHEQYLRWKKAQA